MIIFRPDGDIFSISAKISVKRQETPPLAPLDKGVNRSGFALCDPREVPELLRCRQSVALLSEEKE